MLRKYLFISFVLLAGLAVASCSGSSAPAAEAPTKAAPGSGDVEWQADGVVEPGEYANQAESAGVTFFWTNDGEFLYGAVSAATGGWVAVGFDPENKMQGANYVFGYVADGQTVIEDMYGTKPIGPGSHPPDTDLGGSNDIGAFAGKEEGGTTTIEFQIPLDSGDSYDKPLASGEHKILLALGSGDDLSSMHTGRGSTTITID